MPTHATDDFALYDVTDHTKLLTFDLSALSASTVYVMSFPSFTPPATLATQEWVQSANLILAGSVSFLSDIDFSAATILNLAISDTNLVLKDDGTASKRLVFECSGISNSTTRTVTAANASGIMTLDTSVLGYEGDVVMYDDDLVSL